LLRLVEKSGLKRYSRVTGLYHFAVLFPNRRELARALARLFAMRYPNYPTDHIMTKTTYLDDPEGNGIELYAESPEDGWFGMENGEYISRRTDGSLSNGREALDVDALFSLLTDNDRLDTPVPPETRVGHVHLHVANLDQAVGFYHGILGFDLMGIGKSMHAAFVSAGGYHHHLGLNTWQGEGAPPPPADAAGLRYFTVELPNKAELERVVERVRQAGLPIEQTDNGFLVRDPSQNLVALAEGSK
jgi:catechol 2,3-dioxygenase